MTTPLNFTTNANQPAIRTTDGVAVQPVNGTGCTLASATTYVFMAGGSEGFPAQVSHLHAHILGRRVRRSHHGRDEQLSVQRQRHGHRRR